ncbi:zf-HC2 domain-containing protein [Candidatus Mycobacterium wuenschmannii]|uniref:Zf-HC2 domain-containing protein n=1 Tax=Candidatus Mycobacterium wuenschmannii TaxID=3027808 RepID=A0ABY8VX57_9MYCO|nr:zf-HC2 domain-containing protein [Candidatus Mycobacterium wuenschmannii]WIM87595.1 zf-HC2 domain-containing protein [Candidatus Mycobacterium wuenschmannii]
MIATRGGADEYATWDAAYVLGSLTPSDRLEYETHLEKCESCRRAVAELSDVPSLLAQIDGPTVSAMNATAPPVETPDLLPGLLFAVRRQRRRARVLTWGLGAAASVVLAVSVVLGVSGHTRPSSPPQATVSAQPMNQIGTTALASTVAVSGQHWGTLIDLRCVCLAPVYAHHDKLAMVVVGRDGSHTQLATWVAEPGHTANTAGSISTPVDQIAAVQIVSADNGTVLLQRLL